tara:strand:- start:43 stop:936 length:894 start_codon:yes stop_codon:yes gene_type:complete
MAREERKKEDLFIKEKRRAKNFFITSSAKMSDDKGVTKTTISSSVFTEMSKSFADGEYLLDDSIREPNASILYMLQEMQADIDDVYNEVSASAFQASFFPFARIDSCSIGIISSSLVPDKDDKYNLGSSGKEWHTSYMLTASIGGGIFTSASLAAGGGGGTIDTTLKNGSTNAVTNNAVFDGLATKLNLTGGAMTGLIRPIVTAVTGAPKFNRLDASKTNVYEFNSSKAITIDSIIPAFIGQEITFMNIGSGAITVTRSSKGQARTIYHGKNTNLTINQHEAYKLICNQNQLWYVIS